MTGSAGAAGGGGATGGARWAILAPLGDEERRRVLAAARRRRFGRREVLFHEGDPGDTVHLIDQGRVAVRITTPLGDVATFAVLGPGEVVGELALLDGHGRRSASAVALEPVSTLALTRDDFDELCRQHPRVQRLLIEMLTASLRKTTGQLVEALYVPVEARLARRLLDLAELYAGSEIPLTQEDLASLVGATRGTVNRFLREHEEAGTVTLARGRVVINDPARLARTAR